MPSGDPVGARARARARTSDLDEVAPSHDLVRVYLDAIGREPLLRPEEEVELARRIEAGLYAETLLEQHAGAGRRLTPRRRQELAIVAADGASAKDRMVRANLRLVVSVARRYGPAGVPLLDVVQEGNLGLIRAVEKFDYTKGYKFSTYATWWIRQAIGRGVAEVSRTIRLPVHVVEEARRVRQAQQRLTAELGREPSDRETAEASELSIERVIELREVSRQVISLDTPLGDDESSVLGDLVAQRSLATPAAGSAERAAALRASLRELPDLERTVVGLRFGLHDERPMSYREVGRRLRISPERARRLERAALERLRGSGVEAALTQAS